MQLGIHPEQLLGHKVCKDTDENGQPTEDRTGGHTFGRLSQAGLTDGEAVWPEDVRGDDGRPVRAVHARTLNLGLPAPVGPEHPPGERNTTLFEPDAENASLLATFR